jgi:hypothetical protein
MQKDFSRDVYGQKVSFGFSRFTDRSFSVKLYVDGELCDSSSGYLSYGWKVVCRGSVLDEQGRKKELRLEFREAAFQDGFWAF